MKYTPSKKVLTRFTNYYYYYYKFLTHFNIQTFFFKSEPLFNHLHFE